MIKQQLTICIGLFLCFNQSYAQEVTPSNQTVIRLTILKDNESILMRKTPYGWLTPAAYFKERQTLSEVLDSLTITYGIQTTAPSLRGLFTYKYDFKPSADIRLLFISQYESGELRSMVNDEEIYWLPIGGALDKLEETVSSLNEMTKQILTYPDTIWGGSFILSRVDGKLNSIKEEDFYSLIRGLEQ